MSRSIRISCTRLHSDRLRCMAASMQPQITYVFHIFVAQRRVVLLYTLHCYICTLYIYLSFSSHLSTLHVRDLHELGLQARAADEEAVDIRLSGWKYEINQSFCSPLEGH